MKNKRKKYVVALLVIFILGLIPVTATMAQKVLFKEPVIKPDPPVIGTTPQIDFEHIGITPTNPMVGQEIEVKYKVTPQPFTIEYPRREIVLLLDMSGSMANDKITQSKAALKSLIEGLKGEKNVYLSFVTYNLFATPRQYDGEYLLDGSNWHKIEKSIDDIVKNENKNSSYSYGENLLSNGTNIGDALRKAAWVLDNGDKDADKYIISMTDGAPTNWVTEDKQYKKTLSTKDGNTVIWNTSKNFYTTIDDTQMELKPNANGYNKKPYYAGEPTLTNNGYRENVKNNVATAWQYANEVSALIKEKGYKMFTVGCGFEGQYIEGDIDINYDEWPKPAVILNSIHNAGGGKGDTFFTVSNPNAMGDIYDKIAAMLKAENNTSFGELVPPLTDNFVMIGENKIQIPNIVFNSEVKEDGSGLYYTYTNNIPGDVDNGKPYFHITFKIRAEKEGEGPLFSEDVYITYEDYYGNTVGTQIPNTGNITVSKYDENAKLQFSLKEENNLLIGDDVKIDVSVTNPAVNKLASYRKIKFDTNGGIPEVLELKNGNGVLNYTDILNNDKQTTEVKSYEFEVKDIPSVEITPDGSEYKFEDILEGKYSFEETIQNKVNVVGPNEDTLLSSNINVRRGQIRVKFVELDANGAVVEEVQGGQVKVTSSNGVSETLDDIVKTTKGIISTDLYRVEVEEVPSGYVLHGDAVVNINVNYENSNPEIIFTLKPPTLNIQAELDENDKIIYGNMGDRTEINYNIVSKPFDMSSIQGANKDVVFLLDISGTKNDNIAKLSTSFTENIIEGFFKNTLNTRVGLITFKGDGAINNVTKELLNYTEYIEKDINIESLISKNDVDYKGNINKALIEADKMLKTSSAVNKSIVILSLGDINVNKNNITSVKEAKYDVISVFATKQADTNALDLHNYLSNGVSTNSDYLSMKSLSGREIEEQLMILLKERLQAVMIDRYIVEDAYLNFSLPNVVTKVEGGLDSDNRLSLGNIVFNLNTKTKKYEAEDFGVKFNLEISSDIVGEYNFGKDNNISYLAMDGLSELKYTIQTPVINISPIKHGIYLGGNNVNEEDKNNEFSQSSIVQLAGVFKVANSGSNVVLNIDESKNIEITGTPKVYKVNEQGQLEFIKDVTSDEMIYKEYDENGNKVNKAKGFTTTLNNQGKEIGEIVVLYSVKIGDTPVASEFISTLKVNNVEKECKIKTIIEELPDLF